MALNTYLIKLGTDSYVQRRQLDFKIYIVSHLLPTNLFTSRSSRKKAFYDKDQRVL